MTRKEKREAVARNNAVLHTAPVAPPMMVYPLPVRDHLLQADVVEGRLVPDTEKEEAQ